MILFKLVIDLLTLTGDRNQMYIYEILFNNTLTPIDIKLQRREIELLRLLNNFFSIDSCQNLPKEKISLGNNN